MYLMIKNIILTLISYIALLNQFMIKEFILYCSLSMVETHFSDCMTLSKRDKERPFLDASSDFTVASSCL